MRDAQAKKLKSVPLATLDDVPGFNIRRLQQIAVGIFVDETAALKLTPVQFALLFTASRQPGLDQRTLARTISFDTSTLGGVIDRLEARGLIRRNPSEVDKRVRLLETTLEGEALLRDAMPAMLRAQKRILLPLSADDQALFMSMLKAILGANTEYRRGAKEG